MTDLFDAMGSTLIVTDKELRRPSAGWVAGKFDPKGMDEYMAYYGQFDPIMPIITANPLSKLVSYDEVVSEEFVRKSEFFQDFLIPRGGRYLTCGSMFENSSEIVTLAVQTGTKRGPLEAQELELLQSLWPSLMTAIQVSRRLARADLDISINRLNGMLDAFERMTCAAVLLDSGGRVLAMNRRAERSLKESLRVANGRIIAKNRDSDTNLQKLIASAIKPAQGAYDNALVRIVRPNGKPLMAFVMPVLGVQNYGMKAPAALIVFIDPNEGQNPADAVLVAGYGLTPAEARVASILGSGLSLEETANQIGIRYETARSHLKIIFQKMAIHRQTELAVILARIAIVGSEPDDTR